MFGTTTTVPDAGLHSTYFRSMNASKIRRHHCTLLPSHTVMWSIIRQICKSCWSSKTSSLAMDQRRVCWWKRRDRGGHDSSVRMTKSTPRQAHTPNWVLKWSLFASDKFPEITVPAELAEKTEAGQVFSIRERQPTVNLGSIWQAKIWVDFWRRRQLKLKNCAR